MEKAAWPSFSEIPRMDSPREFLNMAESNQRRAKDGQKGKMIIIDKEGSLMTVGEYAQLSLEPGSYRLGKLPYFLKIS